MSVVPVGGCCATGFLSVPDFQTWKFGDIFPSDALYGCSFHLLAP